jgi:flagellar protein FlaG
MESPIANTQSASALSSQALQSPGPAPRGLVGKAAQPEKLLDKPQVEVGEPGLEDRGKISQAARTLEELARSMGASLSVSVDQDLGRFVVRVINSESGDLIRQIPSKEFLEMARHMAEMAGRIFDEKA